MPKTYYTGYPKSPIGGKNPYWKCSHCGVSDPEINGAIEGHRPNCYFRVTMEAKLNIPQDIKEEAHGATLVAPAIVANHIPKTLKEANSSDAPKKGLATALKETEALYESLVEDYKLFDRLNREHGGQALAMHKIAYAQSKLLSILDTLRDI